MDVMGVWLRSYYLTERVLGVTNIGRLVVRKDLCIHVGTISDKTRVLSSLND